MPRVEYRSGRPAAKSATERFQCGAEAREGARAARRGIARPACRIVARATRARRYAAPMPTDLNDVDVLIENLVDAFRKAVIKGVHVRVTRMGR